MNMMHALSPLRTGGLLDWIDTDTFEPSLDVYETADAYEVTLELPGVSPEDVKIECHDDTLCVRGQKRCLPPQSAEPLRTEREYGAFERRILLSDKVDPSKISATLKDGVLTIRVEKKLEARPRVIQIRTR